MTLPCSNNGNRAVIMVTVASKSHNNIPVQLRHHIGDSETNFKLMHQIFAIHKGWLESENVDLYW